MGVEHVGTDNKKRENNIEYWYRGIDNPSTDDILRFSEELHKTGGAYGIKYGTMINGSGETKTCVWDATVMHAIYEDKYGGEGPGKFRFVRRGTMWLDKLVDKATPEEARKKAAKDIYDVLNRELAAHERDSFKA